MTLGALMFIMERPELAKPAREAQLDRNSQVLLVNSEGNTDPNHFRRIVWDGADQFPASIEGPEVTGRVGQENLLRTSEVCATSEVSFTERVQGACKTCQVGALLCRLDLPHPRSAH